MDIINVNKKVVDEKKEIEITNEIIVPDVKPDILNIICTNGIAYVHKQEITNKNLKIDGNVETTIVYLSSDGDTRSIQTTLNFNQKIENEEIKETSFVKYNVKIKELNSKMINERKINIIAKLEVYCSIYEKQEIKFYNDFENIEGLQKQEEAITINSVIGSNFSKASINEEINVDDMDIVSEILKSDITITNVESKMSYNKILAKAEANIFLIYLTEDNRISSVNASFPVMSFIEISNIKEENICDLDYQIRNFALKINNSEQHTIECQIDFEIMCQAFEKKNINIVNDLYSLNGDLDYDKEEIELEIDNAQNSEIIKIDEKIEINNIKKIFDIESKIIFSGDTEAELKIYYETSEKSVLNVKTVKIPIMQKINDDCIIKTNKKDFSIEGNNCLIQMEFEAIKGNFSNKKISLIQNVEIKDSQNKDDYSVVVYYVKPNDTIWKIAKKFKVTMDSIIKLNDLENPDLIYPGDKLYVLR